MSKRQRATTTINRTRVDPPATTEEIALNDRTALVYLENRSALSGALIGVSFKTASGGTIAADLSDADLIVGPGVVRVLNRPGYSTEQSRGAYTHLLVRANATYDATLDVEEIE